MALLVAVCFGAPAGADLIPRAIENGIVVRGTVVTMDDERSVLHKGGVFVRDGRIIATWQGDRAPPEAASAVQVDLGPKSLIFPGLINLHDHPTYDMLNPWPVPSSHRQALFGRPLGTEPYANRYQWNRMLNRAPLEFRRLVDTPNAMLTSPAGLALGSMVVKYAEVRALLGGQTTIQGSADPVAGRTLIRNVETETFNGSGKRIASHVPPIDSLPGSERAALVAAMESGDLDAWIVHLAEGVPDAFRPPGDPISSRAEFASLRGKGLLTEATVIVHGTGLEADDFAAMRAAPSLRRNGPGDGLGARLVWSPLSNLLLYGRTTSIYEARRAGVLVSLGTDWGPSGSRNLLDELKVADIALRDDRVLGGGRDLLPELSVTGKTGDEREAAEAALDRLLVEMVTINPARTVRWVPYLGSVEPGKRADLLVITRHDHPSAENLPANPYRALIDATEEDVRLVMVEGNPLAGDVAVMQALKPGDYEVITGAGCFSKAVDVTDPTMPQGTDSFASIETQLRQALAALAGDHPPEGGGPAPLTNTYSWLKSRVPGAGALTDAQFTLALASVFGVTADGRLNMEGLHLSPVLVADDDFMFHFLGGDVAPATGLIADDTPPFMLYRSNFNHVGLRGNPYDAPSFRDRYFEFCAGSRLEDGHSGINAVRETGPTPGGDATRPALAVSPNPALSRVQFLIDVRSAGPISVRVHDLAGRLVRTVVETSLDRGRFQYGWDLRASSGARVPSGVYLARMTGSAVDVSLRLAVLP